MAAKRKATNGKETNGKGLGVLEEAMASLARQVEKTERQSEKTERLLEETRREMEESRRRADERTAQIEARMALVDERIAKVNERMDERMARNEERMALHEKEHNELRRHSDELFFEMSKKLDRIEVTLEHHAKALERLPDAIRQEIGFGRQAQP
jgi:F0F1-type ATP synthase membrane subunit b/b'